MVASVAHVLRRGSAVGGPERPATLALGEDLLDQWNRGSLAAQWGSEYLRLLFAAFSLLAACSLDPNSRNSPGVGPDTHPWFPIAGCGHTCGKPLTQSPNSCVSCHNEQPGTYTEFSCIRCHEHEQSVTDRLHMSVSSYVYDATSCYSCHPTGDAGPFDHSGITGDCAGCHDARGTFAALPVSGFNHAPITFDCGSCHGFDGWKNTSGAPTNASDPSRNASVITQIPAYAGTSIVRLTRETQSLPMVMNHNPSQIPAETIANCSLCHPRTRGGFPGTLHASLTTPPKGCVSCHAVAVPVGFVGPVVQSPRRAPSSPEMKHDAVAWVAGARTTSALVTEDCRICHQAHIGAVIASWANDPAGHSPAKYHSSLSSAKLPQPTSCLDCHANSRPTALLANLAGLPAGLEYDHQTPTAMGDCGPCHSSGGDAQWTSWSKGRFHLMGSAAPRTCLPCHRGERPTSVEGWKAANGTTSPFDSVGAGGLTHGDGQDCAVCHPGPGTSGAWGTTQSWKGGFYDHAARMPSACLPCHQTQRPSKLSHDATGECLGCHETTVEKRRYVDLSDWKGARDYPGSSLVAAPDQFFSITSLALARDAGGLVTGMTSSRLTLNNAMKHTSAGLPAVLNAGATPNREDDNGKCWHCHTSILGIETDFPGGSLHKAFATFQTTPLAPTTALSPPSSCADCHEQTVPSNIVEKLSSSLLPMDHSAKFTAAVTLGGASVSAVNQIDCRVCHAEPGAKWADGEFHTTIGSAGPSDCVVCHYPLMADAASADVASSPATRYVMKHRSSALPTQACQTCHPLALGKSTTKPSAVAQWMPGYFHDRVATQPAACNDCHWVSAPFGRTQSSTTYTLTKGATSTNGGQWMSHSTAMVADKDCAACHVAEAHSPSWSKGVLFHEVVAFGVTTCSQCHGGGSSPGANDNRPSGLTDSSTITTSRAAVANTHDQITHSDINVVSRDCSHCHTQVGRSAAADIRGKEWTQALFHKNFTPSNPLIMNGTTGRCRNCHMNVMPDASYTAADHSIYTATSAGDCSACHTWPGTSASEPNWRLDNG